MTDKGGSALRTTKFKPTREQRQSACGYLFSLPLILGIVLVFLPSIIQTIRFSMNDIIVEKNSYTLAWRGFQYYKDAFVTDPKFLPLLAAVMKDLIVQLPIILIFSLFISTVLNQNFRGRLAARIIFFIPVLLSTGVAGSLDVSTLSYATGSMVDTGSSVNLSGFLEIGRLLSSLSFSPTLTQIISGAIANLYQIIKSSGMQIVIFLAGLQDIPASLYEAAAVEGCNKWELFWKITFPMIIPHIAVNAVYTITDYCTNETDLGSYLDVISFTQSQFGLATAMNVIYLAALGLVIALTFWLLSRLRRYQL